MSLFRARNKVLNAVDGAGRVRSGPRPRMGSSQLAMSKEHGGQPVAVIPSKCERGGIRGTAQLRAVVRRPGGAEEGEMSGASLDRALQGYFPCGWMGG